MSHPSFSPRGLPAAPSPNTSEDFCFLGSFSEASSIHPGISLPSPLYSFARSGTSLVQPKHGRCVGVLSSWNNNRLKTWAEISPVGNEHSLYASYKQKGLNLTPAVEDMFWMKVHWLETKAVFLWDMPRKHFLWVLDSNSNTQCNTQCSPFLPQGYVNLLFLKIKWESLWI